MTISAFILSILVPLIVSSLQFKVNTTTLQYQYTCCFLVCMDRPIAEVFPSRAPPIFSSSPLDKDKPIANLTLAHHRLIFFLLLGTKLFYSFPRPITFSQCYLTLHGLTTRSATRVSCITSTAYHICLLSIPLLESEQRETTPMSTLSLVLR
ncbi:hypothetical protein BJ138DRAFT_289877 [Hygrophoropsis aurantiaca]|uniref:Uncharacterized protein n=1 Tax=Hygrophoropsis aurantiaca TaxID=72124 RepID=A0ACB8AT82_9AGAM|nr:hypothetical protein BJ138DRAFT_289877 [Hygrophoropsis aurantiaca]